jgi:hypothetical protein
MLRRCRRGAPSGRAAGGTGVPPGEGALHDPALATEPGAVWALGLGNPGADAPRAQLPAMAGGSPSGRFGLRRGRAGLPRTGGMPSTNRGIWGTSLTLPRSARRRSGCPGASDRVVLGTPAAGIHRARARFRAPDSTRVRAVDRRPRPVDQLRDAVLGAAPAPRPPAIRAVVASTSCPTRSPSLGASTPTRSPSATQTRSRSAAPDGPGIRLRRG